MTSLFGRKSTWLFTCTVSKRVLILRTWSLIRTFLAFLVLIGSLFIFQGPYFHYFGFIHAKNVNSVCMYTIMSYFDLCVTSNYLHCYYTCMSWNYASSLHCWQIFIFTYAYALIFIHRRFGSLFWLLGVLIGPLFHKKMGPYWVLISKLGGLY